MKWNVFIPYLLTMAGVTYLVRALPFVLVQKKIKNRFINSFLHYIPYTVLTAMTLPAIFYATDSLLSAIPALLVAIILAFRGRSLIVVAIGACLTVLAIELLLPFLPIL